MPFQRVLEIENYSDAGNFSVERRKFFNRCGCFDYFQSLSFLDSNHKKKVVPIFDSECLKEDKPETYQLLKRLRKELGTSEYRFAELDDARSIHQNQHGYLPYSKDGNAGHKSLNSSSISCTAKIFGKLPNNQQMVGAKTKGQFLEYTCGDKMHVDCRLIVDYRFGFIYMTFGHYHRDSFALLARSVAELRFELEPTLPLFEATFVD